MHSFVKRNLLGWHGSFVGKKREKAWRAASFACYGPFGKKGIGGLSTMLRGTTKMLNPFFLYTFVNWARVYIEEHICSLIDFVDWLATK